MSIKKIGGIIFTLIILNVFVSDVNASDATFSLYPSNGVINSVENGFTVDILIYSPTFELSKARATIKFDPKEIKIRKAMRNNSLFEQWPGDQSSIDNTDGIVMLTGYTPVGSSVPFYKSGNSGDVFARLEFDIVNSKAKDIVLSFEYSGTDELFKSSILNTASPAQNVLTAKPASAKFTINNGAIPQTAIDMNTLGMIVGVFLILIGGFVRSSKIVGIWNKRGTIVLND